MSMSPSVIWLIAGIVLCLMEVALPTAFVEFVMGISALIVAFVALSVPQVSLQVMLWLVLSVLLTVLSRRFIPQRRSRLIEDSHEARTLTAIPPGEAGRVIYEGNSWRARCEDENLAIAADQKVVVVERQGTTLIVLPEYMVNR
jgi:membrane protein implicated in regulation of membrane protease activity